MEITTLTANHIKLAHAMIDYPSYTNKQWADVVGISEATVYKYKQQEVFKEYFKGECRKKFEDLESLALQELKKHVKEGNIKAVTYVLDNLGYKVEDRAKVTLDGGISIEIDYGDKE